MPRQWQNNPAGAVANGSIMEAAMKDTRKHLPAVPFETPCGYCFERWATSWDHILPWSFRHDDRSINLYPACQRCNSMLGNMMFGSLQEKREYVRTTLIARGLWKLPIVPEGIQEAEVEPVVLLRPVPLVGMECETPAPSPRSEDRQVRVKAKRIKPEPESEPDEEYEPLDPVIKELFDQIYEGISTLFLELMTTRFGPHMDDFVAFCQKSAEGFAEEMRALYRIECFLYDYSNLWEVDEAKSDPQAIERYIRMVQMGEQAREAARVQALREIA